MTRSPAGSPFVPRNALLKASFPISTIPSGSTSSSRQNVLRKAYAPIFAVPSGTVTLPSSPLYPSKTFLSAKYMPSDNVIRSGSSFIRLSTPIESTNANSDRERSSNCLVRMSTCRPVISLFTIRFSRPLWFNAKCFSDSTCFTDAGMTIFLTLHPPSGSPSIFFSFAYMTDWRLNTSQPSSITTSPRWNGTRTISFPSLV